MTLHLLLVCIILFYININIIFARIVFKEFLVMRFLVMITTIKSFVWKFNIFNYQLIDDNNSCKYIFCFSVNKLKSIIQYVKKLVINKYIIKLVV